VGRVSNDHDPDSALFPPSRLKAAAAQTAGNTLVLGMPGGFVPLKNGKSGPAPEAPAES